MYIVDSDPLRQVDFSNVIDSCWAETPPFHFDYSSAKTEWVENLYLPAQKYAADWTREDWRKLSLGIGSALIDQNIVTEFGEFVRWASEAFPESL